MAEHEAWIANPDLVVLPEATVDNLQSRDHCTDFEGGLSCPDQVDDALGRYLCYAEEYRTNPTEVNRINRDTAYCDYLLAFNFCFGANLK